MGVVCLLLAFSALAQTAPPEDPRLKQMLSRLSEEAEVFARTAPDLVAEETFQQRVRETARRFRPRLGSAAITPPKPRYVTREIVSQYGYTVFRDAPGWLHEMRQIVSIDGRRVATPEAARHSLALGVQSDDDRRKKRMIEDFQKHGLTSAAADFGQIIMLFTRRGLVDYSFRPSGEGRIGADLATIVQFRQMAGTESLIIFESRKALRRPLEGEVWLRKADGLPLRVVLRTTRTEKDIELRDEATVDYSMSPHGVLVPASVVHRQFAGGELAAENTLRYSAFRKFSAEAEIKFN